VLHLHSISLVQFKNYADSTFDFRKRVIGICGPNGKGKTNLLDAIYYLCFTKSYFTRADVQNAQLGMQGFRIEGNFTRNGETLKAICIFRENGKKEFTVNDDLYEKFAHHIGKFPCVIIAPDDVQIITAGSEERRRFMDVLLCQLDQLYLQHLIDYSRVLLQRNSYLRQLKEMQKHDPELLGVYDHQLILHGEYVFNKRKLFLEEFLQQVTSFYHRIAGIHETLEIVYESQLLEENYEELMRRMHDRDLYLQRTHGGIHKDELQIRLKDQPFKSIGSQGQRKSLLFALKLAEFEVLKKAKGFPPLLLLDDVFEKLDEQRMHHLLHWVCLQNEGQIFITDTHSERIKSHFSALDLSYELIVLS